MVLKAKSAALKESDERMKVLGKELNCALDQPPSTRLHIEIWRSNSKRSVLRIFICLISARSNVDRIHGEVEQLRRENHRLNEELCRVRVEADRRVFTAYNAFPIISDGF